MESERALTIGPDLDIPLSELSFSFSGSSGPGGQHVNRTATKVTLRFDVASSPSLSEEQRERLLARLSARIDGEGVLRVHAQDTRGQRRNREIVVERFRELLAAALHVPRPRTSTRPSAGSVERRLDEKRRQSARKRERQRPRWVPE